MSPVFFIRGKDMNLFQRLIRRADNERLAYKIKCMQEEYKRRFPEFEEDGLFFMMVLDLLKRK